MITTIRKNDYPDNIWRIFIDDPIDDSHDEHRRGSSFYRQSIFFIDHSDYPELHGYWESDMYVWDENYGQINEITTLSKVQQAETIIVKKIWIKLNEKEIQSTS